MNPLVSIVVITYNSADFVIETLESAKSQTYKNIELIISDDSSKDNTLEVCEKWLAENKNEFVSSTIVRAPKNSGIPANCNRGINAANGEWIKIIAGDDILLPGCIQDNINFTSTNQGAKIVFSNLVAFLDQTDPKEIVGTIKPQNPAFWSSLTSPEEQYKEMLIKFCGNTPSFFTSADVFLKVSFDEQFPFIEDYPFALNATKNGFMFLYQDKDTVMYRKRNNSVVHGSDQTLFGDFHEKSLSFNKMYRYPALPVKRRKFEEFEYQRKRILNQLALNKNNILCRIVNKLSSYLNPY